MFIYIVLSNINFINNDDKILLYLNDKVFIYNNITFLK